MLLLSANTAPGSPCNYIEKSYSLCEYDTRCRAAFKLDYKDYAHFSYLLQSRVIGPASAHSDALVYDLRYGSLCNNTMVQRAWLQCMHLSLGVVPCSTSSGSSHSAEKDKYHNHDHRHYYDELFDEPHHHGFAHWYAWLGLLLAIIAIIYTSYVSKIQCERSQLIYARLGQMMTMNYSPDSSHYHHQNAAVHPDAMHNGHHFHDSSSSSSSLSHLNLSNFPSGG